MSEFNKFPKSTETKIVPTTMLEGQTNITTDKEPPSELEAKIAREIARKLNQPKPEQDQVEISSQEELDKFERALDLSLAEMDNAMNDMMAFIDTLPADDFDDQGVDGEDLANVSTDLLTDEQLQLALRQSSDQETIINPTPEQLEEFATNPPMTPKEVDQLTPKKRIEEPKTEQTENKIVKFVKGGTLATLASVATLFPMGGVQPADAQIRGGFEVYPNGEVRGKIQSPDFNLNLRGNNQYNGNYNGNGYNNYNDNQFRGNNYDNRLQRREEKFNLSERKTVQAMQRAVDDYRGKINAFKQNYRQNSFNQNTRADFQEIINNAEVLHNDFTAFQERFANDSRFNNDQKQKMIYHAENAKNATDKSLADARRYFEALYRNSLNNQNRRTNQFDRFNQFRNKGNNDQGGTNYFN